MRDVCQRTGSKAMVIGSIASLGSQYVIGLKAVNCNTGDVLAGSAGARRQARRRCSRPWMMLRVSLRGKLGESLSSVQKYATPLEATTPSLEALKAYSLGQKTMFAKGATAALPFSKRAVELDPNFATAYTDMWMCYSDLGETGGGGEWTQGLDLRGKVSEREAVRH